LQEEVKDLIIPLVMNKVKPHKILNDLEDYADKGIIVQESLPTSNKISSFKRNFSQKGINLETEADFEDLHNVFDP